MGAITLQLTKDENMTTKNKWPDPTELARTFLRYVADHDGAGESELHTLFNPAPSCPKGASWGLPQHQAAMQAWHDANEAWKDSAYGSPSIPYRATSSSHRSLVCIALTKAGLMREHNNGYNCYSYTITPKGRDALRTGVDVSAELASIK